MQSTAAIGERKRAPTSSAGCSDVGTGTGSHALVCALVGLILATASGRVVASPFLAFRGTAPTPQSVYVPRELLKRAQGSLVSRVDPARTVQSHDRRGESQHTVEGPG